MPPGLGPGCSLGPPGHRDSASQIQMVGWRREVSGDGSDGRATMGQWQAEAHEKETSEVSTPLHIKARTVAMQDERPREADRQSDVQCRWMKVLQR
ncbi:hypothetical protein NDU88_001224 [Pleurodeles waltl]|uniref:Uncharacterized protein n=1 Tax=Pleurodeles waltl TaxID=8319 RepID=A0AAV7UTF6_PLEWA|nr:hypothetical protein NDU88_001224 [Pleurodeles waltl]